MKARPILFSGPMIRALLAGTKTQTRRVMKPQPSDGFAPEVYGTVHKMRDGQFVMRKGHPIDIGYGSINWEGDEAYPCPYGKPGDVLWVKETWRPRNALSIWDLIVTYAADGFERRIQDGEFPEDDWTMPKAAAHGNVSPLFMPRWASRLTLRITDVRVQRLQEISEADADAEGFGGDYPHAVLPHLFPNADAAGRLSIPECFGALWESINGPGSWGANPWVWAISFETIKANVDDVLRTKEPA